MDGLRQHGEVARGETVEPVCVGCGGICFVHAPLVDGDALRL